jgi:hypothetical protein
MSAIVNSTGTARATARPGATVGNGSNNNNNINSDTFRVLKLHIVVPSTPFHCHENVPVFDSVTSVLSYFRTQLGLRGRDESYSLFLDRRPLQQVAAATVESNVELCDYCLLIQDAQGGTPTGTSAQSPAPAVGSSSTSSSSAKNSRLAGRLLATTTLDMLEENDRIIVATATDVVRPKAHPRLLRTAVPASNGGVGTNTSAAGSSSTSTGVASCYSAWRDIAHDGNDYYRAAMFAVLENILEIREDCSSSANTTTERREVPVSRRKQLLLHLLQVIDRPTLKIKMTQEELASRRRLVKLLQSAAGEPQNSSI